MEKHFCTCRVFECPHHPCNHNSGCDACILKNLNLGEIPACFWNNVSNGVTGATEWSMVNFANFCLKHVASSSENADCQNTQRRRAAKK